MSDHANMLLKIMRKIIALFPLLATLSACGGHGPTATGQDMTIDLVGTDAAHCILSTDKNRYALVAPGKVYIERGYLDLKIDCKDNFSDRRRVMTIEPDFGLGYWDYPEAVTVNFATLDNGDYKTGFRNEFGVKTEKSYSLPPIDRELVLYDPDPAAITLPPVPKEGMTSQPPVGEFELLLNEKASSYDPAPPSSDILPTTIIQDSYQGRKSYPIVP